MSWLRLLVENHNVSGNWADEKIIG